MQDQTTGQIESNRFESAVPASDPTVAVFEEEDSGPLKRVQHFLHAYPTTIPFIILVLSVVIFSFFAGSRFFAPLNLSLVLQQVTIIAVLGIAQTLIILTAGIDLSVGAIMVLSSIVMGRLAVESGVPVYLSFPIGLLTGIACGWLNGVLVTKLRLPPFIVTLGTWSIFGALVLFYSKSETIRQQDVQAVASFLQWTGYAINDGLRDSYAYFKGAWGSESWPEWTFRFSGARVTYGSILMLVMAFVVWYILNRTAFGRHVYATGDDPDAARLAGINTDRTLLAVYTVAGLICAIAGWVLIGRIGAVSPLSGATANLDSITAVVIGGTSLFGGRGSIVGTLIGALIVGVFRNGLALAGLDALWQEFAVGVLIIVAVALDQWIRRVST
jgi:fructose transport system permease protein